MSLLDGARALFAKVNKKSGDSEDENQEGIISEKIEELELKMSDEEISDLTKEWKKMWNDSADVKELITKRIRNEKYYKGKHSIFEVDDKASCDNILFEAVETFLPQASKQSAEPVVDANGTDAGLALSRVVEKMLGKIANKVFLKSKFQMLIRHWIFYYLGVIKIGWDVQKNDITLKIIRPQKLILDPDATIEDGIYTGEFIGEYRSDSATNLIARFPKEKEFITEFVDNKLGTKIEYIEWWTDEYTCWTLESTVLGKIKNPHWNYAEKRMSTDERGQETPQEVPGINHLKTPQKPYIFLSIYNLGLHPFDETNNFEQNIANQDRINSRNQQLDINLSDTNNGFLVSGDHFDKEQASQVTRTLRKGGTVWVPEGSVNDAVNRTVAPPLPQGVFNDLQDRRNELRNIFGVRGSSAQGIVSEQTVRGKIMIKGQDTDRMVGITSFLEVCAEQIFNWFLQLMYVYYDEPHTAMIVGDEKAKEFITLSKGDLTNQFMFENLPVPSMELVVTVKEGSMIPHDNLTERNEAQELFVAGKLDPITAFERLDFPNPRETAKKLVQFSQNPLSIFPDLMAEQQQQQMQQAMMQGVGMPPPDGGQPSPAPPSPAGMSQEQGLPPSPSLLNNVPIQ